MDQSCPGGGFRLQYVHAVHAVHDRSAFQIGTYYYTHTATWMHKIDFMDA